MLESERTEAAETKLRLQEVREVTETLRAQATTAQARVVQLSQELEAEQAETERLRLDSWCGADPKDGKVSVASAIGQEQEQTQTSARLAAGLPSEERQAEVAAESFEEFAAQLQHVAELEVRTLARATNFQIQLCFPPLSYPG